ncbi:MAG: segregation/condensation protein A [Deltaproteobacteria bacterium]|nr:segregation/condensation protein A [Deltaproteobacteria bacterium]
MAYNIKLDIFEGPLDLLLHLIRKNEVDIYDIPIAVVTEQYLDYIEMMKTLNLDMAGEFLLMAATLVHIKSRMLLPILEETEEGEEGCDPRAELVRRLLEYQRFKDAAEELAGMELLGRDVFKRGADIPTGLRGTHPKRMGRETENALVGLSIFELLDALKEVLAKAPKTYTVNLDTEKFKVMDKMDYIMDMLSESHSAVFVSLFPAGAAKIEIIVTFLAMLELARLLMIRINQTEDRVIRIYLP